MGEYNFSGDPALRQIWVVEDEERIADVLKAYLEQAGFEVRVFYDGSAVVDHVRQTPPDMLLLDLMVPGKDGMEICREVRRFSELPILMITARVEEIDRLLGLELGADDYICKPFSPREVVARVKTVLRRMPAAPALAQPSAPSPAMLQWQGLAAWLERYEATLQGHSLPLTPREFSLLCIFMRQPGRVYSREQLMDQLYHEDESISDRAIDTHIKNLRKKIADVAGTHAHSDREYIQSIYGVGYKLV
ncbi:MAG: response regulator [Hahellaceae bacterium]|nr:response regulator [Hahellaceae bacterium]MCP5169337.1 response regulator [Hahellaceae bacterium]